ncbi:MAG: sugar phosphate isomerase/epimerase [Anaerolineae bacterium]
MSDAPALSTMWLQTRYDRVVDFACAARGIGFTRIELSHILPAEAFDGFAPGAWDVATVHHPCPLPPTRVPLLSDLDPVRRAAAVAAGKMSIDTAVRFGAPAVVLHVGDLPELEYWEDELRSRTLARQQATAEYAAAVARFDRDRAAVKAPYLAASLASLQELAGYAGERGVRLGLETREFAREIPDIDDMAFLLDALPPNVGFWLDTGHVAVTARLGRPSMAAWLQRHGQRLIGLHLHDTLGLRDHLIPGLGDIDFASLTPYLRDDVARTCELDWFYTPAELRAGVARLVQDGVCAPLSPPSSLTP